MVPTPIVIDGFLLNWQRARDLADAAVYTDVESPVDGVVYPGIWADLPGEIQWDVQNALQTYLQDEIHVAYMFMRLSVAGAQAPHQAHTDSSMGTHSMMVYMTRLEHCQGGTSLLRHKQTGMTESPVSEELLEVWRRDTNTPDAWDVRGLVDMAPNRAFIFPSERMHRAEPIGGFGNGPADGRLVLTAFFNAGAPS